MSKPETKQVSIFQKVVELGNTYLDSQIFKAKTQIINSNIEDEFFYGKAVIEDPSYSLHSQGYLDKPYRITNAHLKQMSYQNTAVAGVIQTRQNQASAHSRLVKSKQEKGFMIELRDEAALLEEIKKELQAEAAVKELMEGTPEVDDQGSPVEKDPAAQDPNVAKAESTDQDQKDQVSMEGTETTPENSDKSDDEVELQNFELERKAREELTKRFAKARKDVEDFILNCGKTDNRPFESLKWNFDAAIRAWVRDTLTYDIYSTEKVPDRAGRIHYWFPVDGGTIKYASKDLRKFRDMASNFYNIDILYPERSEEAQDRQKAIDLKQDLLDKDAYKYVQVIRGKVERAYTADELAVGIRNVNTDIYNNGYGISELELLIAMVTGHLNAEYYNQAYFTQGFSAKGILHIKAAINRRKLEMVRMQWQHMLKGAKNSFQTPIFAGVEDVKWIPLTQNHNDIGFEGWMRYLITMIGCIYQIDPVEMGIHFKAEGAGGNIGGTDATKEKQDHSKDRGLYPLMMHLEHYINEQIIKPFDKRFVLKFTGINGETPERTLARQKEEVKFKKTVNEIRAEDGLPPLPGMDDVILDPAFMTWYSQFSPKGMQKAKEAQDQAMKQAKMQIDAKAKQGQPGQPEETPNPFNDGGKPTPPENDIYGEGALNANANFQKSKPTVIEVYNVRK